MVIAQQLNLFASNNKWGYTKGSNIVIPAQYDTAFSFDKSMRIALVGNKNLFSKTTNPLTGEEQIDYDYFYINSFNQKIKVKDVNFPDSVTTLPNQMELSQNYLDEGGYFKILFQNKVFLFSKSGKQISEGYDDVYLSKFSKFYFTENYTEVDGKPTYIKGLIDTIGNVVAKNKYHDIKMNEEDSVIYCCSAVFSNKLSDDVFNYQGAQIYVNKKHIEFSSKNIHVMKTYEPSEAFIIENEKTKKTFTIEGQQFLYLKENKAIIVKKSDWYLLDLMTGKDKKVNKDKAMESLGSLLQ